MAEEEEKKEEDKPEIEEEGQEEEEKPTLDDLTPEEIEALSEEELAEITEYTNKLKKKKKKKLILIILGVILIGVGGAFFGGVFGGDSNEISLDENDPLAEAALKKSKEKQTSVFMDMPDIVVNLNSKSRRPHFINLKLTLELAKQEDVVAIESQMPRIIDAFNVYLREMRKEDLQGSAGLYRLEHEMMLRLQKTLVEGEVTDILFREIIIQ